MFGLGGLLDHETGKADINMKVKVPTFYQNKDNKGASAYESFKLKEGEGIAGRQELGKIQDLLKFKQDIESALQTFSKSKTTKTTSFVRSKL